MNINYDYNKLPFTKIIATFTLFILVFITFFYLINKKNINKLFLESQKAYEQFLIENNNNINKTNSFIYYSEKGEIIAIKQGILINKIFSNEAEAFISIVGNPKGYVIRGTNNSNLFAVYQNITLPDSKWKNASITLVGDSITENKTFTKKFYYDYIKEILRLNTIQKSAYSGSCFSSKSNIGFANNPLITRYQIAFNTDIIIIFMGTNDFGYQTPLGNNTDNEDISFYGALNTILPTIKNSNPNSQLVVITPLRRYYTNPSKKKYSLASKNLTLTDYVNAIKNVCKNNNIPVIDLYEKFPLNPKFKHVRNTYMPDGLHPNPRGHELIGRIIAFELEKLNK